jgi:hypothetical protein
VGQTGTFNATTQGFHVEACRVFFATMVPSQGVAVSATTLDLLDYSYPLQVGNLWVHDAQATGNSARLTPPPSSNREQ